MRKVLSVSILLAVGAMLAAAVPAKAAGDLELRVTENVTSQPAPRLVLTPVSPALPQPVRAPSADLTIFDPFGRLEPRDVR